MPPAARKPGGRRRKGADQAHGDEGSERWLVTYADMLTVLLALFIVLFAISSLNQAKFEQLKHSLASAFGEGSAGLLDGDVALNDSDPEQLHQMPDDPSSPIASNSDMPPIVPNSSAGNDENHDGLINVGMVPPPAGGGKDGKSVIDLELESFKQIEHDINASLDKAGMSGAVEFAVDRRGLIITVVTDALVFPGNSATLLNKGHKLLKAITPPLTKVANSIEVDGYTNQLNVSTGPYPSGWELSSARASTVVRYLESHGLADRPLAAVGYSDQRPLVPPDDPRSVTRNRRVEIVVISSLSAEQAKQLQQAAKDQGMTITTDMAADGTIASGNAH